MASERLDQLDFTGQVIRVVRADLMQFLDQLGRDTFGLMVASPAMNDSMSDSGDLRETDLAFEPIDQQADGRFLVWGIDRAILVAAAVGPGQDPPGIRHPDPIDPTGHEPLGRIVRSKSANLRLDDPPLMVRMHEIEVLFVFRDFMHLSPLVFLWTTIRSRRVTSNNSSSMEVWRRRRNV